MSGFQETEQLTPSRCLELVGSHSLGRIALSQRALPTVVPVAYRLVGDRLVFASPAGSGVLVPGQRPVVAFQVDEIDPSDFTGWSVVVVGAVQDVVADHPSWRPLRSAGLGGPVVALTTEHIEGRRFSTIKERGTP